jgi:ribosomal protein S18 acetylase RimI-like enzyme
VYREAMRPHVEATYGSWDEPARQQRFREKTDPTTHEVIELSGKPVGCQWVRRHADALELVRLYLVPEAQGRGVGTLLVRRLLDEALSSVRKVRLQVMKVNPARRLYRRLGFRTVAETETHYRMEIDA